MSQSQSQSQTTTPPRSLFGDYRGAPGGHDEYLNHAGTGDTPWQQLAARIDELGPEGLATAWKRGEDMLRENGIAHHLLTGGGEQARRWNLDPIPVLLTDTEWDALAAGAIQRAKLWDGILRDLYGPQTLLSSGLVPTSLIFSQPNYNHPLRFLPRAGKPLLSLYALDVARGPDGSWTVVADRTEAPNGTGFALENRIVLSNVFPETSKNMHLMRLASFYQDLRSTLHKLAPSGVETPKVVLLSPGPGDPSYFEDAYLSRYLGITLALGEELTLRNDRLYLKTVRGLERVHVVIRRVRENDTDPLETPSTSHLGVPGLMQAIRAGSVVMVNPPGTGITEAPSFLPFLPAISRQLLGQDLLLPSIATHWTGQGTAHDYPLDSGPMVVKSAFARSLFEPVLTRNLSPAKIAELRETLAKNPGQHVIQREMPFSTAPAWTGTTLEARPIAIRLFLYADGENWRVMPGGLVRSASSPDTLPGLSPAANTDSKDLWVLGTKDRQKGQITTNLPARVAVRRSGETLSSRSADNMFWLGRYSERAEFASRVLLEIALTATAEQDSPEYPPIPPLLRTLTKLNFLDKRETKSVSPHIDRDTLLQNLTAVFLLPEGQRPAHLNSVPANLHRLRSLASLARDRLSNESWRIIQKLESLAETQEPATLSAFRQPLQQAILLHSAFNGTCRDNLTRTESWRFLNIGRRLERCLWLLTLLQETLALYPDLPPSVLDATLSITDCTLTYRFRYQGPPQPLPALDLLLFDPANPRGLAFQLAELDQIFAALPPSSTALGLRPAHRILIKARAFLQTEVLEALDDKSEAEVIENLRKFISSFLADLPTVSDQLGWEFFSHASFTAS